MKHIYSKLFFIAFLLLISNYGFSQAKANTKKKKLKQVLCAWCAKDVKYGKDFFFVDEPSGPKLPNHMMQVKKEPNSPGNAKYYMKPFIDEYYYRDIFCSYGCAFNFGKSKGYTMVK